MWDINRSLLLKVNRRMTDAAAPERQGDEAIYLFQGVKPRPAIGPEWVAHRPGSIHAVVPPMVLSQAARTPLAPPLRLIGG